MSISATERRQFFRLAKKYKLVPVVREILSDLDTPVSAFRKLGGGEGSFLLESVEGGETWGRYSILGVNAAGSFRSWGNRVEISFRGKKSSFKSPDTLDSLRKWLAQYSAPSLEGLPRFFGGAVGSLAYEMIHQFESLQRPFEASKDSPDMDLMLVTDLMVFDNLSNSLKLVACAIIEGDAKAALADAELRIDKLEETLKKISPNDTRPVFPEKKLRSESKKLPFQQRVKKIVEHIKAGDIFQLVLSHELSCKHKAKPLDIYRAMRRINPSPYMYFLDFGRRQIIGTSPEVLVRVEDDHATVRPIAGTRKRGKNLAEDDSFINDLLNDEKEKAEHLMLVDLGRNDLGRVCEYGSVETTDFMSIEKYSHVLHMVSQVEGTLRKDLDAMDALKACFPAGTVSGAPKIRAMELISQLEQRARGVYAGAIGYFSFGGSLDTCIAIRTIVCQEGIASIGVGAGIVLDSKPEREWEETWEKANAAAAALAMAERGLQ